MRPFGNRFLVAVCAGGLLTFWVGLIPRAAAIQPIPDSRGAVTLALALQKLPVVASMLHIGAHPDDENSALVAYVSRGLHARTAYLALNRGEGGQNLIGPELYDGIGVIRTEELLAARRFDGAEQYFTRAYDFGFSKQASEALELWGREELLADVVRVVRMFRPDVIVSVFAGAPQDGHGQHQAAGLVAREAFFAAADPDRFPEQIAEGLRPWQTQKLYITNTRAAYPSLDSLIIDTGAYSPALDRSYLELGLAGRSMHRSQDMGAIQRKGPSTTKIKLVERVPSAGSGGDRHLFDGINTSITRLASVAGDQAARIPALQTDLARIDRAAREAIALYRPFDPAGALPPVLSGLNTLRALQNRIESSPVDAATKDRMLFYLHRKEQDFIDVAQLALGLSFDVLTDAHVVTPGGTFRVDMQLLNRSRVSITPKQLTLAVPEGWSVVTRKREIHPLGYNETASETVLVTVANDARFTQPYWHRASPNAARVTVEEETLIGLPWRPPAVVGLAAFEVNGTEIAIRQPAQYRYADRTFGEIRRELQVAPALSVRLSPESAVIPVAGPRHVRPFRVTVHTNVRGPAEGVARLDLPDGWRVTPPHIPFSFTRPDQAATMMFEVTPPEAIQTGTYRVAAYAEWNGQRFDKGYETIAYPHIETRHLYRDAVSEVHVFDVKIARDLRIGYIMGAGDNVPQALEQLGVQIRLLDETELSTGDLSAYDVIVAGIRAYEVRRDLTAYNHRLLEYVRRGGTYIVQYNKYEFNAAQYGPYPARIDRPHDRVTREDAPVRILEPRHPVFHFPNTITAADFDGWIQERGLYFLGEWDSRYTPLMESHDPGETPKRGGLVEARYGQGRYIYTGYAWFRQLPAGVPGAFRLFANLLSLPRAEKGEG